jgi:hypothetical protein
MNLLRIITPEEIGEIATKHNGGKFLSLTDLVTERVEQRIYRDFSSTESMNEIHDVYNSNAKILPFKKVTSELLSEQEAPIEAVALTELAKVELKKADVKNKCYK